VARLRSVQDRNAWVGARLADQLSEATVRSPHKRFAGGPLPLLADGGAAVPTAIAAQRLLLQSQLVAAELALSPIIAGPGPV
jgi:hypothetical protein